MGMMEKKMGTTIVNTRTWAIGETRASSSSSLPRPRLLFQSNRMSPADPRSSPKPHILNCSGGKLLTKLVVSRVERVEGTVGAAMVLGTFWGATSCHGPICKSTFTTTLRLGSLEGKTSGSG